MFIRGALAQRSLFRRLRARKKARQPPSPTLAEKSEWNPPPRDQVSDIVVGSPFSGRGGRFKTHMPKRVVVLEKPCLDHT